MRARRETAALLLVLSLCLMADGIMEAYGPGAFALVSVAVLAAAEAMRISARAKRKAPCKKADQSTLQEAL